MDDDEVDPLDASSCWKFPAEAKVQQVADFDAALKNEKKGKEESIKGKEEKKEKKGTGTRSEKRISTVEHESAGPSFGRHAERRDDA
jgi:hypothetical protein